MFKSKALLFILLFTAKLGLSQVTWFNVDSLYGPLPGSVHVYKTNSNLEDKANIAFYVVADLKDRQIDFTSDTSDKRRLTPSQFYERNERPLVIVNCTFFSFETNKNLSLLIKEGKIVAHNNHIAALKGNDSLTYVKYLGSALGISKRREADVAWIFSDSSIRWPLAFEQSPLVLKDSLPVVSQRHFYSKNTNNTNRESINTGIRKKWKMKTAVGGGPVLIQQNRISITNNEERKFMGKAINDKHPRTAIGYANDNKLIILVVQGRMPGVAEGATLLQEAQMLKDLGCVEALNLDGGGSSCLLINGKETIIPSDKGKQRAVPAVFMINRK
jgi:exopolysaccharide biosynthesis protein